MTRQPKSCYATADLLTHISRKGAGETGAKCPASRNTQAARAKRQKQHPPDPLTPSQPTRVATGTAEGNFSSFFGGRGFFKKDKDRRKRERDSFCVGNLFSPPPPGHGKVCYD